MELTKSARDSAVFIDVNSEYTVGGKKLLVVDEEAINGKITNVLVTPKNSLVMEPNFGCDLERYLKEPFTQTTASRIESDVLSSVMEWVDEIIVTPSDVKVRLDNAEPKFYLNVSYRIRQFPNLRGNLTLAFANP